MQVTAFAGSYSCDPMNPPPAPCEDGEYYVRYVGDLGTAMQGSSGPDVPFWISSNPAATLCTSNPDCQQVTADQAACLFTSSWSNGACAALANNVSAWSQLVNCTTCGNPSSAVWGVVYEWPGQLCYNAYNYDDTIPMVDNGEWNIYDYHCSSIPYQNADTWTVRLLLVFLLASASPTQSTLQRAAWKVAATNRVVLNDTLGVIAQLRALQVTGMAADYDNAYMVCVVELFINVMVTATEPRVVSPDELQQQRHRGACQPCTTQQNRPIHWRAPFDDGNQKPPRRLA